MTPPPKKIHDSGVDGLTFDTSKGVWRWRNRITNKRKSLGKDLEPAQVAARELNRLVELQVRLRDAQQLAPHTVGDVVDLFIDTQLDLQPWGTDTAAGNAATYRRYKREFGTRPFARTDRIFIGKWLNNLNTTADTYNGHRLLLIKLWAYGISEGLAEINEAEKTLPRSMAANIKGNAKVRKRLELDSFWTIHKAAPEFLKIAMEMSLLSLQARQEIVNIKYEDDRDEVLYIIRQKTAQQSDCAFIALPVTPSIRKVISRSKKSGLLCPYVVHTIPLKIQRSRQAAKPHPFAVTRDHISKTYKKISDSTGIFAHLESAQQPGFHEIRSLGSRCLKDAGYSTKEIGLFTGHASEKTTRIYTNNPDMLRDSDFRIAGVGLVLEDLK